jgi:hypothetical protein
VLQLIVELKGSVAVEGDAHPPEVTANFLLLPVSFRESSRGLLMALLADTSPPRLVAALVGGRG